MVRNTRDVDILLNESDLERAIAALEAEGFIYRRAASVTMFLDGPNAKARDAVRVVFAGKKVRKEYPEPVPDIGQCELIDASRLERLPPTLRSRLEQLLNDPDG